MANINLGQIGTFYTGTTEPTSTTVIWLDTSTAPAVFKVYDSTISTWVSISLESRMVEVTLTDAQIKALDVTPITIIPDSEVGTGKVLVIETVWAEFTGTAYNEAQSIFLTINGTGTIGAFVAITANTAPPFSIFDFGPNGNTTEDPRGLGLEARTIGVPLTGGDAGNTIKYKVFYKIVDF